MAAMVWLMPGAERAQFQVITLMTWLIAIGGFTHIVAGSMEAYLLVLASDWAWWQMIPQFMLPELIGNGWRYRALRAPLLCSGHGGDLTRLLKPKLKLKKCP